MQRLILLLLTISLLLDRDLPVRSEFELDRVCGYGTARCRKKCQNQEYKIGRCLNTYACCLKKWDESLLNFTKH
ncbi:beta-defensin 104A [Callithrix jacchus]|uniref:Beta-defensin n=1 Tax=Callithrix jacchus TaxID=9483 RepID=A8CYI3_CALJA|nr:beta-defensin 104A [Callithrix jacchus]ABV32012.1 beta-defensin 104 [Callithrix jacchus]